MKRLIVALMFTAALLAQQPAKGPSRAEKLAAWVGEKVTIIGAQPPSCPPPPNYGKSGDFWKPGNERGQRFPENQFAGQTAVIVQARPTDSFLIDIVLQLEDGQRIATAFDSPFGFQAELEAARKWIGRSLWARGAQTLLPIAELCEGPYERDNRVALKNLEKITITAAEFGTRRQKIYFHVKTGDGREAILDGWDGDDYVDIRYHLKDSGSPRLGPYSDHFYYEDQRKLHPAWSPAIWKLIVASEVAVGMTEEMAKLACGQEMPVTFHERLGTAATTEEMHECSHRRFVLQNGKVTRLVDSR